MEFIVPQTNVAQAASEPEPPQAGAGARTANARPKATIVIGALNRGGCERHLVNTLPGLAARGFDVEVFTITERGELAGELEAAGIRVDGLEPMPGAGKAQRIARIVRRTAALHAHFRRRQPSIAHFFLPHAYLLGAPVALTAGVPVRIMSRRSRNHYQARRPLATRAERMLHAKMTMVLGNAQAVIDDLICEGVPASRRHIIYNGVNAPVVTRERAAVRHDLGLEPETVVMTIVANLIGYKGHADLIEALALVQTTTPWHCLVVGEDRGIGQQLRHQVVARGLTGQVSFLGQRRDVPNLLTASDIGLLSSHEEGFSNAVLEGMAAGLPMIVTDVGGNKEAIVDGETGLLVPAHAPAAFAAAIQILLHDQEKRAAMGAAGKQRVQTVFSEDACISAYAALYAGLL